MVCESLSRTLLSNRISSAKLSSPVKATVRQNAMGILTTAYSMFGMLIPYKIAVQEFWQPLKQVFVPVLPFCSSDAAMGCLGAFRWCVHMIRRVRQQCGRAGARSRNWYIHDRVDISYFVCFHDMWAFYEYSALSPSYFRPTGSDYLYKKMILGDVSTTVFA